MADGAPRLVPELKHAPEERTRALGDFDNSLAEQLRRLNKTKPSEITPAERAERARVRQFIFDQKKIKLTDLVTEESRLIAEIADPSHARELLRASLVAVQAEQERISAEMRTIERQRSFLDNYFERQFPKRYDDLVLDFYDLEEKINALNKKLDHPDIVHEETLRHLAAVRKKISDLKIDIAYFEQEKNDRFELPHQKKLAA